MNFNSWLYEACKLFCAGRNKDPHDIFPYIDMTDAKLSFLDGMPASQYSSYIYIN